MENAENFIQNDMKNVFNGDGPNFVASEEGTVTHTPSHLETRSVKHGCFVHALGTNVLVSPRREVRWPLKVHLAESR